MKYLFLLLLCSCSHVFYQPTNIAYFDPHKFVDRVDDTWFKSKDGTNLNGWWMPSIKIKPKGTIVFFHGNAENISSHFLNLAWITHAGYNVFIFDYRGYGVSQGEPNQKGVNEDSLAALDKGWELHQKESPNGKFIVFGQSLGGIISLRAIADYKNRNKIDLIVQDSTFMSYTDLAFDKLKSIWLTFPLSPLAYVLVSNEYASEKVIDQIHNPLLVIVGKKDLHIPYKFGTEIYKRSKSKKKWIWKIKDGYHIDVFARHDQKYRKDFIDLLEKKEMNDQTKAERKSDRELVASRRISALSKTVFEAWVKPELFKKWWVPKSAPIKLESCEMDVRTGGKYLLKFSMGDQKMDFFGKYLEVTPNSRLVWTNEEGGKEAAVVTTVTFKEIDGATLVTVHDQYPSKKALDEAIASESTGALPEQLEQLEELVGKR